MTVVKPTQFKNAEAPIFATLAGMETEVNALQPEKVSSLILVTEVGITIEVNQVFLNALEPILVTLEGIKTEVNLGQFKNAEAPIFVILEGIVTEAKLY